MERNNLINSLEEKARYIRDKILFYQDYFIISLQSLFSSKALRILQRWSKCLISLLRWPRKLKGILLSSSRVLIEATLLALNSILLIETPSINLLLKTLSKLKQMVHKRSWAKGHMER